MSHDPDTRVRPEAGDFELEPVDARSRAEIELFLRPPVLVSTEPVPVEHKRTYTLAQMLVVTTCIGFGLGAIRLLGPASAAGISGVLVLLGLVAFSVTRSASRVVFVLWSMLLGLYILASVIAIVAGLIGG